MSVRHLVQHLEATAPGLNHSTRQVFINKIASGKDACLNFLPSTLIEKVREILGNAA